MKSNSRIFQSNK